MSSIYALVESLQRLCMAMEAQNRLVGKLIEVLVTVEAVEPEPDPDAPPTHDLAGRRIEVR